MIQSIRAAALASTLLIVPMAAFAQDTASVDAKAIETQISGWLPQALRDGAALKVSPTSEGFSAVLDMTAALRKSLAPWEIRSLTPITHVLKLDDKGIWNFSSSQAFEFSTGLKAGANRGNVELNIGELSDTGSFDAALGFFRKAEISADDIAVLTSSGQSTTKLAMKSLGVTLDTVDVKPGVVDVDSRMSGETLAVAFGAFPNPEVNVRIDKIEGEQTAKAVDMSGFRKVYAFWQVPGRTQDVMQFKPDERKLLADLISAHRPFVENMIGEYRLLGISAKSAGSSMKIASLAYGQKVDAIAEDAAITTYLKLGGIELVPEFWPKGLEKMVPQDASISVRYYGVKMKAVWDELSKPDGARSKELGKIALPNETVHMDFADNFIRSAHYDITLDGKISVEPGPAVGNSRERLRGNLVVVAKDYDKTVRFLQDTAKTVPEMNRAAMVALMAKGLGKTETDGSVRWDIGFVEGGKVVVNGQTFPF